MLRLPCRPSPPQVEYSKQLNESRIKVLQAREDAVQTLLHEAFSALAALSKDQAAYKRLLTDLLVQVRCSSAPLGAGRPWARQTRRGHLLGPPALPAELQALL